MGERERLRDRFLILLTELAEAYAQMGYYRRAINACRQVLVIEPCREAVYMHLMVYYYYAGEKNKALQVYDQCQQVLSTELGVDPDISTRQLEERIRSGSLWSQKEISLYPPPNYEGRLYEVPYSLGKVPFAGRDREYAWLIHQWHALSNPIIWIEGEAGVGKTRLAEEFVGYIRKDGVRIFRLRGSGYQISPFAAWVDVFKSFPEILNCGNLSDRVKKVISSLITETTSSITDHYPFKNLLPFDQISAAMKEVLQNSLPGEGLLWVDDAHLLDTSSIMLLSKIIGIIPVLIVCRSEDTPSDHLIRKITENTGNQVASFHLNRLQMEDVQEILEHLNAGKIKELSQTLYSKTKGNPLFIIATLQHLFEQGILFVNTDGFWNQSGSLEQALSPTIEQTIASRLKQVRPNDRRILDVVAVAGGELNYDLLQNVVAVEEANLLEMVDGLIEYGFLVEPRNFGSAELVLSHACYGEVLYKTLPKARRRIYHRRLGEAMLAANMDSPYFTSALANHFHHGEDHKNAFHYAKLAADYALRLYAPQQALQHYQNAENWLEPLKLDGKPDLTAQIWMGIAEALRLSGDYLHAIDYYQKAFPILKGPLKQAAAYQMFQLKALQGESLAAYEEMTVGFEQQLAQEGDSWALALFYWAQSFVFLIRGKQKETRWHNAQGWRVSRRLMANGQPAPFWVQQRALTTMMRAHNQWCNYQTSIRFSHRILTLLENTNQDEDANTRAAVQASLGESYYHLGQYQIALEQFNACYDLAFKAGDPRLQGEALIGQGLINFELGNFEEVLDYASQVLKLSEDMNDIPRQVNARFLQARIAIIQGTQSSILPILDNFLILGRFQQADPYIVKILILLAESHLSLKQFDQSEGFAREAAEISQICGLKRDQSAALRLMSQTLYQKKRSNNDLSFAQQAVELAQSIQAPFELGLAIRNRSYFQNQIEASRQDCKFALNLFKSIGAIYEAGQTQRLLENLKNG